jgi:hypothetical protein
LSKFLTSGPAVTVISLPCGPLSVTSRVALSIAVIVAVTLIVSTTPALPGAVDCAPALPATVSPRRSVGA